MKLVRNIRFTLNEMHNPLNIKLNILRIVFLD